MQYSISECNLLSDWDGKEGDPFKSSSGKKTRQSFVFRTFPNRCKSKQHDIANQLHTFNHYQVIARPDSPIALYIVIRNTELHRYNYLRVELSWAPRFLGKWLPFISELVIVSYPRAYSRCAKNIC